MTPLRAIATWRSASLLVGLSLVWMVAASPFASWFAQSLTGHMSAHLLLMSFAPALIWLGEPLRLLPTRAASLFGREPVRHVGGLLAHPAVCWLAATGALVTWHVPAALTLGMHSEAWHAIEQVSFFLAGLLFWWPVVRPWPSATEPGWWIVVYLFLATLPCDILSGFLVFSERVVYPVYLSTHRHSGLSALNDQQYAGALMWTVVTIVYFVVAGILSAQLLSPQGVAEGRLVKQPGSNPDAVEVI
jgi:putative membrane protein